MTKVNFSEREIFMHLFPEIYLCMYKRRFFPLDRKPQIYVVEFINEDKECTYNVHFDWKVLTLMNDQEYLEIRNIIKEYNAKYKKAYTKTLFKRDERGVIFTVRCSKLSNIFLKEFKEYMGNFSLTR